MDQDDFRHLLSQPSASTKSAASKPQIAKSDPQQPAFKPRKVKKSNQKYRDRAAERREGVDSNDYAQIESILDDISTRTELQHNANDDDSLEQAFQEVSASTSTAPQKRTREELIRELKDKRTAHLKNTSAADDQTGKLTAKFKPIGAPGKLKSEGERKKKKKKADVQQATLDVQPRKQPSPSPVIVPLPAPEPEPESEPDEDLDIFAGAGEYKGLDFDDDDEGATGDPPPVPPPSSKAPPTERGRWFLDEEPEPEPVPLQPPKIPAHLLQKTSSEENADDEESTRLMPLTSSALPSIRDFLAMDDAVAKEEKKRKRKEKKKDSEGKNMSVEGKLDRDYKRLKSYTDKQAGSVS